MKLNPDDLFEGSFNRLVTFPGDVERLLILVLVTGPLWSVIVILEETGWGLDELTVKVDLFVNVDSVGVILSDHCVVMFWDTE